jgi:AbrB family looped-hinge helix DNA binding protein
MRPEVRGPFALCLTIGIDSGIISESMTFGTAMTTPARRLVRIQEKGQVTLPADVRRKLGLNKGDLVAGTETDEGVLISPQHVVAMKALERVSHILAEQGVDLNEMIASGRDIRGDLLKEDYGIDSDTPTS